MTRDRGLRCGLFVLDLRSVLVPAVVDPQSGSRSPHICVRLMRDTSRRPSTQGRRTGPRTYRPNAGPRTQGPDPGPKDRTQDPGRRTKDRTSCHSSFTAVSGVFRQHQCTPARKSQQVVSNHTYAFRLIHSLVSVDRLGGGPAASPPGSWHADGCAGTKFDARAVAGTHHPPLPVAGTRHERGTGVTGSHGDHQGR
jgi:hypothetical protein